MKKTGIVLLLLSVVISIFFLSLIPAKKAPVGPVKITKKIPAPESGQSSKETAAKQSPELNTPDKIHAENNRSSTPAPESGNPPAETAAKPSPALTPPDESHAGKRYSIQIDAFKDFHTAVQRSIQLKSLGHNSFYRCETIAGKGNLYRVYTELYDSKEEAEKNALLLKDTGLVSDYMIKSIDETAAAESGDCQPDAIIYFLHVSSHKQKTYAEEEVQRLRAYGYNVFTISENVNGESWFRIYIGDFDNEKDARKFGAGLVAKGLCSYFKPIAVDNIIQPPRDVASMSVPKSISIVRPEEASPSAADESKSIQTPEQLQAKTEPPLEIRNITFKVKKGIREIVFFHANRYFSPLVSFKLEGEQPEITVELKAPATIKNVQSNIPVNGDWIKQIQIQPGHDNKTVRIIVSLAASEKYKVSQSYYKSGNVYALKVVSEESARTQ